MGNMSTMIHYEIYKEKTRHLNIEIKDNRVEALDSAEEYGVAVRVIKDGKLGFAYSSKQDVAEKELVEIAAQIAENVAVDSDLIFPKPQNISDTRQDVELFSKLSIENKKEIAKRVESSAKDYDKRIKGVRKAAYDEYVKETEIKNSNGIEVVFSSGLCLTRITAIAEENGQSEWSSEIDYSLDPAKLNPEEVGRAAARRAISYLGSRKISSRRISCLLDKDVVSEMLDFFAPAFFADSVYKKKTPFSDKIGERVYSDNITIIDDATLVGGFSSVISDGEGVPSKKTIIVKDGRLNSFLSDTLYAKKLGIENSASSTRSQINIMPRIGIHNLYIEKSTTPFEKLLKELNNGLYVTDVMGLHTANAVTGNFSVGVAGFLIENGDIVHGVKQVTMAGNFHDVLNSVIKTGSDIRLLRHSGSPSLLVNEIVVSG